MYIFDASSIINLIKKGAVKPFANGATINLALYESLNAIWKEHQLLKKIDKNTALQFIDITSKVFNILQTKSIKGLEKEIYKLAAKENLTIYDASYLYTAIKNKSILVTDDQKLRNKAKKYVETTTSDKLASKYKT